MTRNSVQLVQQHTLAEAAALSTSEWIAESSAGRLDNVIRQAEQHSAASRDGLSDAPETAGSVSTQSLAAAHEFFKTLCPNGSAQLTHAQHALGLRLLDSTERGAPEQGRELLHTVFKAAREFFSVEYQARVANDIARAELRCGNPSEAARFERIATELPTSKMQPLLAVQSLAEELPPFPQSLRTAALYQDGREATAARLQELRYDDQFIAIMLGDLSDTFHEAWKQIHFMQRGADAPRWKETKDADWIRSVEIDVRNGATWIRTISDGAANKIEVNIAALPNQKLPSDRALDNFASAYVALNLLAQELQGDTRPGVASVLRIADSVHQAWLTRNSYVFDTKYDEGQSEDSASMRLMRKPFAELYELGTRDAQAAAEARKDVEVVLAAMFIINDAFKADLPVSTLLAEVNRPLVQS